MEIQAKATKTHKSRRRLAFARPLCSLIVQQRHGQAALTRLRCLTSTRSLTLLVAHDSCLSLSSALISLPSRPTVTDCPNVGVFPIHLELNEASLLLCMQSASKNGIAACLASVTLARSHKCESMNAVQPLGRPDLIASLPFVRIVLTRIVRRSQASLSINPKKHGLLPMKKIPHGTERS